MEKREWPRDVTRDLISDWEQLPQLWDISGEEYKNKNKRREATEYLADKYGTNAAEIGRKLHNLRTQYANELRKQRRRELKSACDEDAHSSKWEFFDRVSFLQRSYKKSTDEEKSPTMKRKFLVDEDLLQEFPFIKRGKSENLVYCNMCNKHISIETKGRLGITEHISTLKHQRKLQQSSKCLEKANNEVEREEILESDGRTETFERTRCEKSIPEVDVSEKVACDNRSRYDEAKIFGDFVASSLRGFRSWRLRRQLERRIQSAILELQEMDDADVPESIS